MFNSIRSRILIATVLIVVCALSVNTFINYLISNSANTKSINNTLTSLAASHTATVDQWIETKVSQIASLVPHVTDADPVPLLTQIAASGNFMNVDIGYPDKRDISSDPSGIPPGYDPTSRPWYIQAVEAKKAVVTNPYLDVTTRKLIVTVAAPRIDNGQLLGVVEGDINMDAVIANVRAIHPTEDSFGMLMDADGTIIAHADESLTLKPLSEIAPGLNLAQLLQSRIPVQADIAGRATFMIAMPVKGTSWFIVVAMDKAEATASMRSLLWTSTASLFVLIALAALIVTLITRRSIGPLIRVREAMDSIADGTEDLTRRLKVDGKDEVAQIASAFNRFVDKLAVVMKSIRSSSESVRIASQEIAAGNIDLSSRTESAAASLQQTSAALEQISSTVALSASASREANSAVLSAAQVAQRGGASVRDVIQTMNAIEAASEKIGNIIGVIDGIAFQTNILALNASVEAARAGEQGRGFAVVANEVRNLASRSAEAAKEIRMLINTTVASVSSGAKQVHQTGDTMQEIVSSVSSVTTIMAEINQAADEQMKGIAEINIAVVQLDTMVQQNAALVEESTSASAALTGQASDLAVAVNQFRL
ncbi:methyl-accepting chemotaxis protein [Enterobacteriaceae bacterium H20N1]|uniref:Methyl-accepting chemotaxis protein n=1 Tax=Dryocola boscaweniae TaxID=2925397 RepID=A0A9X2W801_9ENTR|nr:methyl-accepting chemotaxis protein [Dryocola boscaweniae]MCT4702211.1 methyl-accepting chemotaxis protein [Dryocola boscaweniae]MCT4714401.1 methyl-accepting chemotaxis protein [Dryocola boscaweniae]MCT4719345.1 methyl-accepting chemotaxis protein [Dryocola boscaweniae]